MTFTEIHTETQVGRYATVRIYPTAYDNPNSDDAMVLVTSHGTGGSEVRTHEVTREQLMELRADINRVLLYMRTGR